MDFNELPEENKTSNVTKNRITLIMLALVFVAPVASAYLAYYSGWFTGSNLNKGTLVKQYWHFDDLNLNGELVDNWGSSEFKDKWMWLLVIDDKECSELCQINWFMLQQTRLGLGKRQDKANWLMVLNKHPV